MSEKPRILIITDTAVIHSGMGVACKELATRLHHTGKYDVATFGWFWNSAIARGILWDLPFQQFTTNRQDKPYGHPDGWPNPSTEQFKNSSMYKVINEMFRPQLVIGIGDYWMLDFMYKLKQVPGCISFKFIHEIPIDGAPIPKAWAHDLRQADILLSMSKYGKRVMQDAIPGLPVTVLGRGIDTNVFQKFNASKDLIRKQTMPSTEGHFVVGLFDRFQDRKQIGRALEGFAKFISDGKHDDCDLYLHTDIEDQFSTSQRKTLSGDDGLIKRYSLTGRVIINKNLSVEKGVSQKELVALYNCCDVKLSTTQGEGWGLTTVEAMACCLPCISTHCTTMPELLGENRERGLLADVSTTITGMYNIERSLVDTDSVARHLDLLYRSPSLRFNLGENARKFVQQFRWDTIIKKWEQMIDGCLQPTYKMPLLQHAEKLEFTKDIAVYGAMRENTGWAITTRGMSKALTAIGWNVNVVEGGGVKPNFKMDPLYTQLMSREKSKQVALINHMPQHAIKIAQDCSARFKMIYFPYELDHMINSIVHGVNRFSDIYLCPTKFVEDTAKRSGVINTAIIPLASDINTQASPVKLPGKKAYNFLMIGNLGDVRKGVKFAIKAFVSTFTGNDDVALILKSLPGHQGSDPSEYVASELLGRVNPPTIEIIHTEDADIAGYYAACDCLVFPSLCEGWGHPAFEALKFGMPIIASNYGGYLDFIHRGENVQLIKGHKTHAWKSPDFKAHETWFIPDFVELSCSMKKAYSLDMRKTGVDCVADYTWEKTAKAIDTAFNDKVDKRPRTRVYFERMMKNLWNQDNEIGFKSYAPLHYDFDTSAPYADFQILDVTRISDRLYLRNKKYIILFHCFGEWSEESPEEYRELFNNAMFVYSHLDLASMYPDMPKKKFMRGPWGCQPDYWFNESGISNNEHQILCTGEIAETEGIQECVLACDMLNKTMLHVGPNFNYRNKSYRSLSNLKISEMRQAYNTSQWVSALRRTEGFEKPAIEGLLCGARPICFDTPLYRYWYGNLARYVKEGTKEETYLDIMRVMTNEYAPISGDEMRSAIKKFAWYYVSKNFWDKVNQVRESEKC